MGGLGGSPRPPGPGGEGLACGLHLLEAAPLVEVLGHGPGGWQAGVQAPGGLLGACLPPSR